MSNTHKIEKRIHHYKSSQTILTVGEGDFSFSACLAEAFGSGENMIATSLDSHNTLIRKYGTTEMHWKKLKNKGCQVFFEVDVNNMNKHLKLGCMKFDIIIYNFPHYGHYGFKETDPFLIRQHKELVRGFFRSAREMLKTGGEVHVAHRDDEPYRKWELEKQALSVGLVLKEKTPFSKHHYYGYQNKRGSESRSNETFPLGLSPFTFKFCDKEDYDHEILIKKFSQLIIECLVNNRCG